VACIQNSGVYAVVPLIPLPQLAGSVNDCMWHHSKHFKTLCGVLQIINTGVRSFVRCDNKSLECAFRLAQEVSLTAVIDVTLGQYCRLSGFSNMMYDAPPTCLLCIAVAVFTL
jgi:hypothetical protein